MEKMGAAAEAPPFSRYGYGPSVACIVGCTWLMYSLCMAHIWPMYDLHMAHIVFRSAISSAIRSALRTDHQCTLAQEKGDMTADNDSTQHASNSYLAKQNLRYLSVFAFLDVLSSK